ncbi:MAG: MtnX-like HAD-IB family phosphatase [Myxococcales bacterium]|nr:MtnX-like HAD-IB family phosphatase [Myxococcales bacterium]
MEPTRTTPIVILDFDGTITRQDIGDALCDQFADPSWRNIDRLWEQGRLSLDDAQRAMWATFRASRTQTDAWLSTHAAIRDGFDVFIDTCRSFNIPLILASGGFDHYIHTILGHRVAEFDAVFCNSLRFIDDFRVSVEFPFKNTFGCDRCPVCKGKICQHYAQAADVIFVGDGTSDRCAIDVATRLCVVRGSKLHRECDLRGRNVVLFDSFRELITQTTETMRL